MEVCGQHHAPRVLPLGNSPQYTLNKRLGGSQSRSESCGEGKNLLPLSGIEHRF
jgi:hypothetical protein